MSSAVISTSAATSRHFIFDAEIVPEVRLEVRSVSTANLRGPVAVKEVFSVQNQLIVDSRQSKILASITPASRLAVRPGPEMVSSGISQIDVLTGGLPRGCLTEICGAASSGRTTLLLAALAAATRRGECCAIVDASDALDPQSTAAAGVELDRLLWVRCREGLPQRHRDTEKKNLPQDQISNLGKKESRLAEHRLEQLLRAADLLLESGGFGLIALDLADLPPQTAHRIPLATWFRFRRTVEHTPTVLLAIERRPIAGSCSSLLIKMGLKRLDAFGNRMGRPQMNLQFAIPAHAQLLTELEITAEVVHSRLERKPSSSVAATFASKTAWAG
jgi:recA bacterial DNA recombination protein